MNMNPLCKSIEFLPLNRTPPPHPPLSRPSSVRFATTAPPRQCYRYRRRRITLCSASSDHRAASVSEIDMVRTNGGVFAAKPKKVVILWDLDNKPPRGPPYEAAMALKKVANQFGDLVDASAYANRHTFVHLPNWVVEERRERRRLDVLERKGVVTPPEPYVCGVCGRKCKTNLDLKKHFKQLHERERQKKMNRMRALKGKKRQRFKERYIDGNHKYVEAAKTLVTPKVGYGLAEELRRAGVFVKTVEDKPQAADWALKRQMEHSMTRGIDWLVLVSDDSDFSVMLKKARDSNLGTVVVGDSDKALGRHSDLWFPWNSVENGMITEKDLVPRSRIRTSDFVDDDDDDDTMLVSDFHGDSPELDGVLDELMGKRSSFRRSRISAFSEGEEDEEDEAVYLFDIDDEGEDDEEDDWYS